ncbi:FecR family protein [Pseudoalteromonas spongiae]|uniref:FecR family protein n=1 Tax=Pseudoalteromonas spongiae TaxID=298657 RepID=UPI003735860A
MQDANVSNELIEAQAAEWLVALDETTDIDDLEALNTALSDWLAISEEHRVTFEKMSSMWLLADELTMSSELENTQPVSNVKRQSKWRYFAWAASFVCIALISSRFWQSEVVPTNSTLVTEKPAEVTRFKTQFNQPRTITLNDSSVIDLAPSSELLVQYQVDKRVIHLIKGEAVFNVASDKNRPFTVTDGNREATAVGTVFNVKLGLRDLVVSVLEGKVRVNNQSHNALLNAGQYAAIDATNNNALSVKQQPLKMHTADWQNQQAQFIDARLADIIFDLTRYSPLTIYLANDSISDLRFTGTVHFDKVEQWLQSVALLYDLEVQKNGDVRVLNMKQ